MNGNELYQAAINTFGAVAQAEMAIEEMAECQVSILHHRRGRTDMKPVQEEIADCLIMLAQMRLIYGPEEVDAIQKDKERRLHQRILDVRP